jgi:hypothetical protein
MAALPVPTPAVAPDSCRRSPVALGLGLVTLVTGAAFLLAGLLLPVSPSQAIAIPRTLVNPAANAQFDAVHMAEGARHRRLHFTASSPPDSDNRPGLTTAHDREGRDQESQGTVRLDIQQEARYPHHCVGDRAESAHLASITLCQDPRDALAAMATAQYRGIWVRWDATGAVGAQVGSDDRIAQALFAPASDGASASARRALSDGSWRPRRPPWFR